MKTMQERIKEIRELMRMKEELDAEITAAQFTKTTTSRRFCIA